MELDTPTCAQTLVEQVVWDLADQGTPHVWGTLQVHLQGSKGPSPQDFFACSLTNPSLGVVAEVHGEGEVVEEHRAAALLGTVCSAPASGVLNAKAFCSEFILRTAFGQQHPPERTA